MTGAGLVLRHVDVSISRPAVFSIPMLVPAQALLELRPLLGRPLPRAAIVPLVRASGPGVALSLLCFLM